MNSVSIKPETVYCYNTDFVRGVKDTSTFGGPNKWNLEIKDRDGRWTSVQWMEVTTMERILAHPESLTRYPEEG